MTKTIKWTEEEVVVAFSCYLEEKGDKITSENDAVILKVSDLLRNNDFHEGKNKSKKHRNPTGIFMKFQNYKYIMTNGKSGLSGFSQLEEKIVNRYKDNQRALFMRRDQILKKGEWK